MMDYGEATSVGQNGLNNTSSVDNSPTFGRTASKVLAILVVAIASVVNFIISAVVDGTNAFKNTITIKKILTGQ